MIKQINNVSQESNTILEELSLEAFLINCPLSAHNPCYSPTISEKRWQEWGGRGDKSRSLCGNIIEEDRMGNMDWGSIVRGTGVMFREKDAPIGFW
jgi:hypothetical protein